MSMPYLCLSLKKRFCVGIRLLSVCLAMVMVGCATAPTPSTLPSGKWVPVAQTLPSTAFDSVWEDVMLMVDDTASMEVLESDYGPVRRVRRSYTEENTVSERKTPSPRVATPRTEVASPQSTYDQAPEQPQTVVKAQPETPRRSHSAKPRSYEPVEEIITYDAENAKVFSIKGVPITMVFIQGGSFVMGCTQGDPFCEADERPAHVVTLTDFWLGETEVTQEFWTAIMGTNPSFFKGEQRPVESMTWQDCQDFLRRLNALDVAPGFRFALPTEAQWEYAARGGRKSSRFAFSGAPDAEFVAWHDDNSDRETHDVKGKIPNELGLYDMCGNVYECCSDRLAPYTSKDQVNPTGGESSSIRISRGGSWDSFACYCRVSFRNYFYPKKPNNLTGLRLALYKVEPEPEAEE